MLGVLDRVSCPRVCLLLFCVTILTGCQGVTTQRSSIDDKSPAEIAVTVDADRKLADNEVDDTADCCDTDDSTASRHRPILAWLAEPFRPAHEHLFRPAHRYLFGWSQLGYHHGQIIQSDHQGVWPFDRSPQKPTVRTPAEFPLGFTQRGF
jgi:hypothetical protein